MLGTHEAAATIAVKDIARARQFYEGMLGLTPREAPQQGVVWYETGGTGLLVYKSDFAGTNKATSATWTVDELDPLVKELRGKGVLFEHYELPGSRLEGDVHVIGSLRAAWFKDPEGNIHHLVSP